MSRKSICHDITLLLIAVASSKLSTASAQSFAESPVSAIAYAGDEANFTCVTDGSHVLVWTVNGIEARFPEVRSKGITFLHFGINSEISNLTASASIQNNNSEIICIHVNLITGQEIARTPPAYLYVQGNLVSYSGTRLPRPWPINFQLCMKTICLKDGQPALIYKTTRLIKRSRSISAC